MGIPISMKDLPKELQRREKSLRAAARRGARIAAKRGKSHLMHATPVDNGDMKSAWKVVNRPGGAGLSEMSVIENTAPYAGVVERGARPHAVSEAGQLAIYEWVKRHFQFRAIGRGAKARAVGVISKDSHAALKAGERRTNKIGGPLGQLEMDSELVKIAEAIIHKLRVKGQKPTYFVRDSLPDLQRYLREEVEREIRLQANKREAQTGDV